MSSFNKFSNHSVDASGIAHQITEWSKADVEEFLKRNNITGCEPALHAHGIDGLAFLGLTNQHLLSWGIPKIKQTRILVLLNELGSEAFRKDIVIRSQISSRLRHLPHIETPHANKSTDTIKKYLDSSKSTSIPRVNQSEASSKQNLPPPPLPPKPDHLRPNNLINDHHDSILSKLQAAVKQRTVGPEYENDEYEVPIGSEEMQTSNERSEFSSDEDDGNLSAEGEHYEIPDNFEDSSRRTQIYPEHDEFTSDEEDDQPVDCTVTAVESKNPDRIKGFFAGFLTSNQSKAKGSPTVPRRKQSGGDPGTPPILPQRVSTPNSSQGSLHQLGSETSMAAPPMPPLFTLPSRKISTMSNPSSSLESIPASSHFMDSLTRKRTPPSAQSSAQQDSRVLLGNQTWSAGRTDKKSNKNRSRASSPPSSAGSSSNLSNDSDPSSYPWFFNVERKQAESLLIRAEKGTFLIRPSKHGGDDAPFTLSLQFNQRVFHVLIRKRLDGKLALGSEKMNEKTFSTLDELVQHHWVEPMQLHSNNQLAGTTPLIYWPEVSN